MSASTHNHDVQERKLDSSSSGSVLYDTQELQEEKQAGVLKAEAIRAIMGWKLWVAYLGVALTSYVNGLDNNTSYAYLLAGIQVVSSNFNLYTTLTVIQALCLAFFKFPIAKLADVFGRAQGYAIALTLYVIGFIILASSQRFSDMCAGMIFYACGSSGIQIMQQIVLADAVTTRYRGLAISLLSVPYLINFAIAGRVTGAIVPTTGGGIGWRWGYGIFAIIVPVAVAPIIFALALSQQQAKKTGAAPVHPYRQVPVTRALVEFFHDIDLGGLFLLVAGWSMVLIAITIAAYATQGWSAAHIIALLVVGGVCIFATGFYEWLLAPRPILRRRFVFNKDVIFPTMIGFFDFFSFYMSWIPVYLYVQILRDWTVADATYTSNAQSLCLTVFGIMIGAVNAFTRQYKWSMVAGSLIRLLGIALMIAFRNSSATTAQLIIPQVLQGMGGGFLGINLQVAAQVSVPHQDVAMVTAFVLLFTEIGGACGTATLGAIQSQTLPGLVAKYLPNTDATTISGLALTPSLYLTTYPLGSIERTGLINAWNEYMHKILIVAVCLAIPPVFLSLALSNRKLSNGQSCVTNEPAISTKTTSRDNNDEFVKDHA